MTKFRFTLEEAYDPNTKGVGDHWDAWQVKQRDGATQLTLFNLEELDEQNYSEDE